MTVRLIKRDALVGFNPLDADEVVLPLLWNGPHVGLKLVEAMQTLRLLPGGGGQSSGGGWPAYLYEFDDLVEQQKQGELERTQKIQNRTRVSPALHEITRMERVICWPMSYVLFGSPHLVEAVMWVAHAHSFERGADWVARKRGGYADTWRQNHDRGCEIIADGLIVDRVRVF